MLPFTAVATSTASSPDGSSASGRTGRPPLISLEAVVLAGVDVGLPELTVKAVATRLGVGAPALYHHVSNLDGLRLAVGEHIVSSFTPPDDAADAAEYLWLVACTLRSLERQHPGIGAFCAANDPAAVATRATMSATARGLADFGLEPIDAVMLTGLVANLAFSFAARERNEPHADAPGAADELFSWVARTTIGALLDARGSAPWRNAPVPPQME